MKIKIWLLLLVSFSFSCTNDATKVIENPVFERTGLEVLHPHVDKVEINKDSIKVYCSINFHESLSYNIPKTMFLEDLKNNKRYRINKCIGLPFEPEERTFTYGGPFQFVFCFPYIEGLIKFNLLEDSTIDRFFNIYGIDISKNNPQSFEEAEYKHFKDMSDFYKSSGDIDKYVEFEKKELLAAKYIFGQRSIAAGTCYYQLANYYGEVGDYTKAVEMGLQSLDCDSIQFGVENKEYPVYVNTLGDLSYFYHHAGKEIESIQCAQKSIRIRRNIGDEKGYLNDLNNILSTRAGNDSILKRIAIVKKELAALPSFIENNSLSIAGIYKQIAFRYSLIDDNKNALESCNISLGIMDHNNKKNTIEYAELLGLKCRYLQRSGLKDEAIHTGEAAKRLYESLGIESLKYSDLLCDLALAYKTALNYEKSVFIYTKAAKICQNMKDWLSLAEVYSGISDVFQRAEKLDNAEKSIKKAIAILNEHGNAEQYILDAVKQSGNSRMNNPFALANINLRINSNKGASYQTLAKIYQKRGKIAEAIDAELENGKIIKSMGDNQLYAIHLMTLSEYYLNNNQKVEAIACLEHSIQLSASDNMISLALSKLQLAKICFQTGDITKAIRYAEESLSASKSINDNEIKLTVQSVLSYIYWKSQKYEKAEQCLSEALDYLKNFTSNELIGMTTEQKQRLWDKYEHYFLLYRCIIEKSNRNASLLSKLYDYILHSKSLVLDTDRSQKNSNASDLNIKWKDIQNHLSKDDIAIEFISTLGDIEGYYTYHALVIDKKSSSPKMITLYNESKLNEIRKTDRRNIRDIVGNLIWSPILAQYGMVKNIYFSPDGILHLLPIEYYNVNGKKNMFEHYNMYRLSSIKELIRKNDYRKVSSAVLYGGLDYNQLKKNASRTKANNVSSIMRGIAERGGFDPLFDTVLETQEIKKLLSAKNISTTLYSGENGTEESFRNLSGRRHDIIHLATHGMYINSDDIDIKRNENSFGFLESLANIKDPVREDVTLTHSFLVMSGGNKLIAREKDTDKNNDGILTSKEISQLDLQGLDLVVLSSCESALGDVDYGGVYGLQRGFKKAGANTILMSLDKVDDEATRILMVEFYRNLMRGKTKRQSLKEAQNHLRIIENGKYNDPKYWASFIMLDGLD